MLKWKDYVKRSNDLIKMLSQLDFLFFLYRLIRIHITLKRELMSDEKLNRNKPVDTLSGPMNFCFWILFSLKMLPFDFFPNHVLLSHHIKGLYFGFKFYTVLNYVKREEKED